HPTAAAAGLDRRRRDLDVPRRSPAMIRLILPAAALVLAALPATLHAQGTESWNSVCLPELRQIKEDWTRISSPATKDAIAREVVRAEQAYRKGREQDCQQRVAKIKDMMK